MEERLSKFEAYRKEKFKKANMYTLFGVLGIVLGFIFFIVLSAYEVGKVGFLFVVVGFVLIIIASTIKSGIQKKFKNEFIVSLVKDTYPGCRYEPNTGLDLSVLMEPGFFRRPDRYFSEDLLVAEYEGIPFVMADFTFQDEHRRTDRNGHTTVTYETYAKGRYMQFDFKREFNQVIKVLETKFLGANVRGLEEVETESLDFNKKFKCYSSNPLTAFYVLTPQIQLKLLELETKFKGSIFFAFMNGKFYLVINDNVNTLDLQLKGVVDANTLAIIESQLSVPAAVIHELNLSGDKFNSGDAI